MRIDLMVNEQQIENRCKFVMCSRKMKVRFKVIFRFFAKGDAPFFLKKKKLQPSETNYLYAVFTNTFEKNILTYLFLFSLYF